MKKSPKRSNRSGSGPSGNNPWKTCRVDSADIRARIAAADVVTAEDEEQAIRTVFYGREILEEIVRSGVTRRANVLMVPLDFATDEPERLDKLVHDIKGRSSFCPADLFPKVEIDEPSFSNSPELLAAVRLAVDEVRTQHRTLLPLMQRRFYYQVRARGVAVANETLKEAMKLAREAGSTETAQAYVVCFVTLGEILQHRLPRVLVQPTRCLEVVHRFGHNDRKLTVRCRSLLVKQTAKGPAYHSRRMPRMRFAGVAGEWLVAFGEHALEPDLRAHCSQLANLRRAWRRLRFL